MARKQVKEKKPSVLFDFLNSISDNKIDLIETGKIEEKEYNPYMINRFLSFSSDTILYAQQMNELYWIDAKMHYDYLRNAIRKKRRFFKYIKKDKPQEVIDVVAEYHNISIQKAKLYADMLDDEQIEHMRRRLDKGGH